MDQLTEIMSKADDGPKYRYDTDGRLEIFCYYHKEWEHVDQVPYGKKTTTPHGYNTMCKIGVNMWTKQYKEFKEAEGTILGMVERKEITYDQIPEKRAEFAAKRNEIVPLEVTHWIMAHADERQLTEKES